MNLIVSYTFEQPFINQLIAKFIDDIHRKLLVTDLSKLDLWLQVEYGLPQNITCKKIIEFGCKHLEIIQATNNYIIQFNSTVYYPNTSIRLITLLKTISYGTRHFRGNAILLNEFKLLNMNLDILYDKYKLLGVVI